MTRLAYAALLAGDAAYRAAMECHWVEFLPMSWLPEDRPR